MGAAPINLLESSPKMTSDYVIKKTIFLFTVLGLMVEKEEILWCRDNLLDEWVWSRTS